MADTEPQEEPMQEIEFVGMGDVLALHADAFFVVQNGDNFTLCFFQHQYPDIKRETRKTASVETKQSKCIARIAVSPTGFANLAQALVRHLQASISVLQEAPEGQK